MLRSLMVLAVLGTAQANLIQLTKNNWNEMLESPHGWFVNVCREG